MTKSRLIIPGVVAFVLLALTGLFWSNIQLWGYQAALSVGTIKMRRWSVEQLILRDREAAQALAPALDDSQAEIRQLAAEALVALKPPLGPAIAVPAHLELLSGDDERSLSEKAILFKSWGPGVVPVLCKALKHRATPARACAAYALGLLGPEAAPATPSLAEALTDSEHAVRLWAADALEKIGPRASAAASALTRALKADDVSLRVRAARALWSIEKQPEPILPVLIEALDDYNYWARYQAVMSLKNMGPQARAALPVLTKTLKDKEPQVRGAALLAIKSIKGQ